MYTQLKDNDQIPLWLLIEWMNVYFFFFGLMNVFSWIDLLFINIKLENVVECVLMWIWEWRDISRFDNYNWFVLQSNLVQIRTLCQWSFVGNAIFAYDELDLLFWIGFFGFLRMLQLWIEWKDMQRNMMFWPSDQGRSQDKNKIKRERKRKY